MGIRFLCPNGHKLNVKAFLAGERGICPQCDAKFLVPAASGGQVAAIAEEANPDVTAGHDLPLQSGSAQTGSTASGSTQPKPGQPEPAHPEPAHPEPPQYISQAPPPMPVAAAPPPVPSAAPSTAPAPAEVWYVRTAAGDQFGPASTEVMRGWVAEGRVAADCWAWRTGWPDWKSGGQAITFLNGPSPDVAPPDLSQPTPQATESTAATAPDPLPEPTSPTTVYRSTKRNRQERARKVTLFLGVIVLLLFAVLIFVLINNK